MKRNSIIESLLFHDPRRGWTAGAFAAIGAVGLIDFLTGTELTFSLFYLVPVALAAWWSGTQVAIAASLLAAGCWLVAEYLATDQEVDPLIYAWNFGTRLLFLLLVAVLLATLRVILMRERALSRIDPLTGLLNAKAFREIVDAEIARGSRYGHPVSVAFLDIDDFKEVNDTRGHSEGDRLLREVGAVIRANLRASDIVARYGGDEFVIGLPVTGQAAARAVVDKLHQRVTESMVGSGWPVTLSVGVFTSTSGTPTVDFMLDNADRLMYEVKADAKNGLRYAASSDPREAGENKPPLQG